MIWMRVMLTRDDILTGEHVRLQNAFEEAFMAAGGPKAAAMFQNDPSDDEYGFYFSPTAVEIFAATLEAFNARECGAPPQNGTSLSFGDLDVWDILSASFIAAEINNDGI